jgi:hypothetical protein
VYVGQGDGTKGWIDQHLTQKVFWDRAIAFASTSGMLDKINHIAAYQLRPVSAITHYAPVDRIEP